MSGHSKDRAAIVTTAVLQIVTRQLRAWADGEPDANIAAAQTELEAFFRQEFFDIARTARDETTIAD